MKNDKIISALESIEPGESAKENMLGSILEKGKKSQTAGFGKFAAYAACFAVIIALAGIIGNKFNLFGAKAYTADLGNGNAVVYRKEAPAQSSFDYPFEATSRELTEAEIKAVFPDIPDIGYVTASFNAEKNELFRIEGKLGNSTIIYVKDGYPLTDTVIDGENSNSVINGVPVSGGFFITQPNSKGERNSIIYGSFDTGEICSYVEVAGSADDTDTLCRENAELILKLINNGEPNFELIRE